MTEYRALVAIVAYHLADDRVSRWPHGGYGVPAPYLERLRAAGARTAIASPGEVGDAADTLEPFDGLLLVGGGDVDPRRYGQEPSEHVYGVEPDRDEFEIALLHAADRLGVPTLCICRGMQIMNVAFGGTLVQHLPEVPGVQEHGAPVADERAIHEVRTDGRSLLRATTGVEVLAGSSHHHQAPDRIGDGLRATGWTADGVVEAIERERDGKFAEWEAGWMLGVQWHPEETAATDPAQQSLFDALANLARLRGSRARPGAREGRSREYGLVEYDPAWPSTFEQEAARIRAALGNVAVRIEHVGSTSVPGLAAKPIVDIQVSVDSMFPRDRFVQPLVALGYRFVPDPTDTEHEYFSRNDGDGRRTYQIHVCPAGSEWERRHLAFRDHLRSHRDDAARYAELKRRLAAEHPRDIMAYVDAKTPFIREIEERALAADRPARV